MAAQLLEGLMQIDAESICPFIRDLLQGGPRLQVEVDKSSKSA
jgi:hypothetical protein